MTLSSSTAAVFPPDMCHTAGCAGHPVAGLGDGGGQMQHKQQSHGCLQGPRAAHEGRRDPAQLERLAAA